MASFKLPLTPVTKTLLSIHSSWWCQTGQESN